MKPLKDFSFLFILTCITFFIVGMRVFVNSMNKITCEEQTISFIEHDHGFLKGCMVRVGNNWIPLKNVRVEVK